MRLTVKSTTDQRGPRDHAQGPTGDRAGLGAPIRWRLLAGLVALGVASAAHAALNDTGLDWWADGSNNSLTSEPAGYPGQDASHGRDVTADDDTDGHAGFSFTKLGDNGQPLPASATIWSCVRDEVTGLTWEAKTNDGGLHDRDDRYNWYNTDPATNGGFDGYANDEGAICFGYNAADPTSYCNTRGFTARVNTARLCGATDWRLPTRGELHSIVDYSRYNPSIDTDYFPYTQSYLYWSDSPWSVFRYGAWGVDFLSGAGTSSRKVNGKHVRLVRGGQDLPFDTDSDGIPDVIDPDDDNDGYDDAVDAFPLDRTEWLDTDGDNVGNNADPDDDGDAVPDTDDNCPLVSNADQADYDRDGIGEVCDADPFCLLCLPSSGGWRGAIPR